jgi:hypothetical protein
VCACRHPWRLPPTESAVSICKYSHRQPVARCAPAMWSKVANTTAEPMKQTRVSGVLARRRLEASGRREVPAVIWRIKLDLVAGMERSVSIPNESQLKSDPNSGLAATFGLD